MLPPKKLTIQHSAITFSLTLQCSALFPSVLLFLPVATSEQTKTQPANHCFLPIEHIDKKRQHKHTPGCRARAPSRSSASFPGNDSGIPTFPCHSSCSTTDHTRRCAADSAAPSGSASSPCRTGCTRCLRKKRQHWWQYCVGANDAFGNLGTKNRRDSGKIYHSISAARISFIYVTWESAVRY